MKILRLPAVIDKTGLSRSSIYRLMNEGKFPPFVKIGERANGWRSDDIDEWIANLPGNAAAIYRGARRMLSGKAGTK